MAKIRINHNKNLYVQNNILSVLEDNLPMTALKHIEKYAYLAHRINVNYMFRKDKELNDFVPISKTAFQYVVSSRREPEIFKFYFDHDLIESDNSYKVGDRPKGYRFTDKAKASSVLRLESRDFSMNKRVNKRQHEIRQEQTKNRYMKKAEKNLQLFEIDHVSANECVIEEGKDFLIQNFCTAPYFLFKGLGKNNLEKIFYKEENNHPFVNTFHCNTLIDKEIDDKKKGKNPLFSLYLKLIAIDMIKNKDFFFIRDKTGNRLHTNITILKRELRKFLYVPNLDLVNLDIANSQPLFLLTLFQGDKKYKRLCEEGMLWDYLMSLCEVSDRTQFKKDMFAHVFYCQSKTMLFRNNTYSKLFKSEFPKTWRFIYKYKKEHGYKSLSIEMQRREANLIIDVVCKKLAEKDIFFATIHDSIITDRSKAAYAIRLMEKGFKENYGINPLIKFEEL